MTFKSIKGSVLSIKGFLFFFILTVILFTFPFSHPLAAEEFATSYDVTYDVGADGVTTVTEKISLKNLTSQYFATQFSLTLGTTQISDVSASDGGGPLDVKQENKGTSTVLTVKFNQQVAGQGKEFPWTLTFKSKDFASQQGKVWEVSVPKVVSSTNLENYNVTIAVPASFGNPTSISPNPRRQTQSFGKLFLNFDKDQLLNSGVSANFGTNQLFDFDLSYHLENPGLVPIITNVALPPDTAYQDVIYQRIDPKPDNVTVDDDGNYLAWYRLARGQKIDVKAIGSAKIYTNSKVKNPTLDPTLRTKYLSSAKYWEKDHQAIKTKLSEILVGKENAPNLEKAELIDRYVANTLKYDSSRLKGQNIERLGAVTALNNPDSAVCMEYTDLFIALARAAGIPAREHDGYAYTANSQLRPLSLAKDILHAWPEFYDESRGWIMIDPTWESTTGGVDYFNKLDLNHFTFAIKGLSSEQPVPAGSYKYIGQETRDVNVHFAEKDFLGKPQLDIRVEAPNPITAGFPGKIKVIVSNAGNALQPPDKLSVIAGQLTILGGGSGDTGPIPAFGKGEFEYNVRTKSFIDSYDDTVEIMVAGQKLDQKIEVRPFIIFRSFPYVLIGIVGAIALIYFLVLGTFVYRRRILGTGKAKK